MSDPIVVTCPECGSTYRLKPEMAGKRMRCTDAGCRAVFEVAGAAEPELAVATPVLMPAQSGEAAPAPVFDWRDAPPPAPGDDSTPTPVRHHPIVPTAGASPAPIVPPVQKSSARKLVVAALAVFVLSTAGWGITRVVRAFTQAEERLSASAGQAYTAGEYGKAAERYAELATNYPRSVRAGEYRFYADLAELRRQAGLMPPAPQEALALLNQLVTDHGHGPYIKVKHLDIYEAALKTLDDFVLEGRQRLTAKDVAAAEAHENLARQALTLVERFAPAGIDVSASRQKADDLAAAVNLDRAELAARAEILKLLDQPKPDLEHARELIDRAGFRTDADLQAAWQRAVDKLRTLVTYQPMRRAAQPASKITSTGILPMPKAMGAGPRVPVLARGVLAALDAKTGRIAWADRLGADATWSPLVISGEPERWLVVGTEPLGISARDVATGDIVWTQPLDALPIGSPVLAAGRVFVALSGPAGIVLDIDAATGELLGGFATGQPLSGGIGIQAGASRLYVPANAQQLYVFDVAPEDGAPRCIATLTTGHAPASVRRAPAPLTMPDGKPALILELADAVSDTALELFRLPDTPQGSIVRLDRARVPGWTWFAPAQHGEQLAALGDRGVLGLFGLRQTGASDPPLFPLIEREQVVGPTDDPPQRSLTMIGEDGAIITSSGGLLKQWRVVVDRARGRRLAPGWSLSEPIGSPIQVPTVANGMTYLTTQRTHPPACLATALRSDTGEIAWQRSLGFDVSAPFVNINGSLLTFDHAGAVMALSSTEPTGWTFGAKELAGAVSGLVTSSRLLRGPNGQWMQVSATAKGVTLRRIGADFGVTEERLDLPAALAGVPGFSPSATVLPLANGQLVRIAATGGKPAAGPTWRGAGAVPNVLGSVTHWFDDTYLVHDGGRRLVRLNWPSATEYDFAAGRALERPQKLLGPALVLTGPARRAVVTDAGGNVLLVSSDSLHIDRTWRLGANGRTITAGPVSVGEWICVVLDSNEVVALHPDRDAIAWRMRIPEGQLVGTPGVIAGRVSLADCAGRVWLLDAATGKPLGAGGHLLPGSSVAVAAPIELAEQRVFVPLADGTGMILTLEQLLQ